MTVVLFCGGLGMRLRDYSEHIPKPMAPIGYRPMLWHVMKYYAHYGHKEFILCLGFGADVIKTYFINYCEWLSNDFVLSKGGKQLYLVNSDIHDWTIIFADTGLNASIGQRLKAVEKYLDGEEVFLANYSDGLTDLPLPAQIEHFHRQDKIASFLSVRPHVSYHFISADDDDVVRDIRDVRGSDIRINGGYFVFNKNIFSYIRDGEDLLDAAFPRLAAHRQLVAYKHDGFWACLDTFKDKQLLDDLYSRGNAPWEVWKSPAADHAPGTSRPRITRVRTAAHVRSRRGLDLQLPRHAYTAPSATPADDD